MATLWPSSARPKLRQMPLRVGSVTLPPIIFPGRPERWWGDEALKAETDPPQATLEQRHQAAGDVLPLRRSGFFFGGGSVFGGVPQSGRDRPIERQRENQDEPVEPIGALDLAGLEIEPPGLEIREHRLDAPAQAVVARTPWRGTLGHGDDPWFGLAVPVHHGDMRARTFSGQRDVLQPVFAARETIRQGRLAAVVEHAQVLLAAQPPAPAVIATPGDHGGRAVEKS